LCLTDSRARLSDLEAQLTGVADGCLVNPRPGEARRSRMADVPVLALSLRAGETLLDFADA
jgi:hypothetical protein